MPLQTVDGTKSNRIDTPDGHVGGTIASRLGRGSENFLRATGVVLILFSVWWLGVVVFSPPPFILPSPDSVLQTLFDNAPMLLENAAITLAEIILGLVMGTVFGCATALLVNALPWARRTIMPVLVASQALPVFAIAPLLVLWFGLGLGSKIAMATLIIYFPIASALNDGLARAEGSLIDLARLSGANRWQTLLHFRLPAAMPSLASGIRVAATIAPIGAVVGEWVGAAGGLGYVINQANARVQTDMVFAALLLLVVMVVVLRAIIDAVLDHFVFWAPRSDLPG